MTSNLFDQSIIDTTETAVNVITNLLHVSTEHAIIASSLDATIVL